MERNEELEASLFSSGIVRLRAHFSNPFRPGTWTSALFPAHKPKPQQTKTLLRAAQLKLLECVQQPQSKEATYTPIFPPSLPLKPLRTSCRGKTPLKAKSVSKLVMESNNDVIKLVQHRRLSPQMKNVKAVDAPQNDVPYATYKSKEAAALRFRRRRTGSVQLNKEELQTFKTTFVPVQRTKSARNVITRRRSITESRLTFGLGSSKNQNEVKAVAEEQEQELEQNEVLVPAREKKKTRLQRRASLSAWVSKSEADDANEFHQHFNI